MTLSFSDHIALLTQFLDGHSRIIEEIERRLLNVQGKEVAANRNREHFEQAFNSCFFNSTLPRHLLRLQGQLAAAHAAEGFEPALEKHAHQLDPLELVVRGYDYWDTHRWPGKNGRMTYARNLYSVSLLRQLEHLGLRIWDDGKDLASDHLRDIQRLLDRLNDIAQPNVFVRDARWLIQTAQGPLTRNLEPYFKVAAQISGSFTDTERVPPAVVDILRVTCPDLVVVL